MAMQRFDEVVQEYGGDKQAVFRTLALVYLEREPDALLLTRLRQDDFGERPLSDFWRLLDYHKARLTRLAIEDEISRSHRVPP